MDNWRLVKIGTTQAQRKLFFSLNKERKLLEAQGFKPDAKMLAERLNVKESEVIEMSQRMESNDMSMESPVRDDSDNEHKDFFAYTGPTVEEEVAEHEIKEKIAEILEKLKVTLNEKEKVILVLPSAEGDEPTYPADNCRSVWISRERVRQIEAKSDSKK